MQDLLDLGAWGALRRLSAALAPGFWAHPQRPALAHPDFPHWRASLWRPEHPPLCGAQGTADAAGWGGAAA